jgi:hypothetical protein
LVNFFIHAEKVTDGDILKVHCFCLM